jgi:glyoxylase-like metal-dependent hydrolase (beta-lactamase superfamily II)
LIDSSDGYLLFDAGWPSEYREFKDNLKKQGIRINDITKFLVSHFHLDHAGLAGLFQQNGIEFTVFENQFDYIQQMEDLIEKKGYSYKKIDRERLNILKLCDSRKWLKEQNIDGEIIQTYGHGDYNIALLLDDGNALTGDLPIEYYYNDVVKSDWDMLKSKQARCIYPAHADEIRIESIVP